MKSSRRIACRLLGCCTAMVLWESIALADAKPRPNILFIFADDLGAQAVSAYGEKRKLLETPHLDRIAREGMRFDRCLVTNSICGPSRATILTGKYSHVNGFYNNSNSRFDSRQQTFPRLLQAAGYDYLGCVKAMDEIRCHLPMTAVATSAGSSSHRCGARCCCAGRV